MTFMTLQMTLNLKSEGVMHPGLLEHTSVDQTNIFS